MPLQEPPLIWAPLVKVLPVQKLMKFAASLQLRQGRCSGMFKGTNSRCRRSLSSCDPTDLTLPIRSASALDIRWVENSLRIIARGCSPGVSPVPSVPPVPGRAGCILSLSVCLVGSLLVSSVLILISLILLAVPASPVETPILGKSYIEKADRQSQSDTEFVEKHGDLDYERCGIV